MEHASRTSTTYRLPGLVVNEHEVSVPLDHATPHGDRIRVFAREVADADGTDRAPLLFLTGGPGMEAPRPSSLPVSPGWLARALKEFRVILLDQRGTGRSTPVGTLSGISPGAQADYLRHFRADAIVRDAECLRQELDIERWSVLGQSFGGFCATTYLSLAPGGLREAFITGGLPPLGERIEDAYAASYQRVLRRSREFFTRFPGDRERVRALQARLEQEDIRLPNGDRLTSNRVRQLGSALGVSTGADMLHHLLELPPDSSAFLYDVLTALPFGRDPLYAIVHECGWADGGTTRWAAQRLLPPEYRDEPELFTGEHLFPWMFDEYSELAPLREAAHLLAEHEWPRLYDERQLAANEVPVAAAVYLDDMYVDADLSRETAAAMPNARVWITNEYEHNGLNVDGAAILERLLELARGRR